MKYKVFFKSGEVKLLNHVISIEMINYKGHHISFNYENGLSEIYRFSSIKEIRDNIGGEV